MTDPQFKVNYSYKYNSAERYPTLIKAQVNGSLVIWTFRGGTCWTHSFALFHKHDRKLGIYQTPPAYQLFYKNFTWENSGERSIKITIRMTSSWWPRCALLSKCNYSHRAPTPSGEIITRAYSVLSTRN